MDKQVFNFSEFYAMDSTDEHYSADDSYYNSTTDVLYEEYIVQVDFEDTELEDDLESKNIVVQLRDGYNNSVRLTVNTALFPMLFSVYNGIDVNKSLTLTTDKNVIYMGASLRLDVDSRYSFNRNNNSDIVYETTHIDDMLGLRITVSSGSDILTAADLAGIYLSYKGENFFPQSDGSYRIKIADAVSNVLATLILNTENGNLESGTYTFTVQSFGSIDGVYFSSAIAQDAKNIQVVSTNYGFNVTLDDNAVLINKTDGKNKNNSNNLNFGLEYSGTFEHPKIVVSLYRRKYDNNNIYSYEYDLVDLDDFVTNTLITTNVENEYLVVEMLSSTHNYSQNYTLTMNSSDLVTGTYKVVFSLYDGTNRICDMHKPIIIR